MSLSERPMQTAILTSPGAANDTVEVVLDAPEDRRIHSVDLFPRSVNWTAHDFHMELYIGNDPTAAEPPTADDVDDHEQLYLRRSILIEADTTNGQGGSYESTDGTFDFDAPFPWDEHVSLTLELTNNSATQMAAMAVVRYTEA